MKKYRIAVSSNRKHFLVDPKNSTHYFLSFDDSYFAKETIRFRTIEEGFYHYFNNRYVLRSDSIIPFMYK